MSNIYHASSRDRSKASVEAQSTLELRCVGFIPEHALEQGPVYIMMQNSSGGPQGLANISCFELTKETCVWHNEE